MPTMSMSMSRRKSRSSARFFDGLERESDHDSGAGLVTAALQSPYTCQTGVEVMPGIVRMDAAVEGFVGGFDAQEIPVGACFPPTEIGLFRLFPEGEGDAERSLAELLYLLQESLYPGNKRFVLPFAALQDNGAVAVPVGECGGGEDGIIGQVVAPGLPVGPPDAAVEAVFDAEVGNFYQPAHVDAVADGPVAQFAAAGV